MLFPLMVRYLQNIENVYNLYNGILTCNVGGQVYMVPSNVGGQVYMVPSFRSQLDIEIF